MERKPIKSHRELEVYQLAFETAMKIFELSKRFPKGDVFAHGSDPPFVSVGVRQSDRSLAQAAL